MKKKIIIALGIIVIILLTVLVILVINNNKKIVNDFSIAIIRKNSQDDNLTYIVMDLKNKQYSLYEITVTVNEDETFTSSNNLLKTGVLEEKQNTNLDKMVSTSFTEKDNYNENDLKYGKGIDGTYYIVYNCKGFNNGILDVEYKGVIDKEQEELKILFEKA